MGEKKALKIFIADFTRSYNWPVMKTKAPNIGVYDQLALGLAESL